jgi:hypothetical protein
MVAIRVHFDGKVFIPEDPVVNVPRNTSLIFHAEVVPEATGQTMQGFLDVLKNHTGSVQAPADWSAEHDHYLYGTPKHPANGAEKP